MPDEMIIKPSALTIRISSDSDEGRLVLTASVGDTHFDPILHPSPAMNPKSLEVELINLRKKMTDWSKQYESFLLTEGDSKVKCDPEKIKAVWKEMAEWGRSVYIKLFDLQAQNNLDLVELSKSLKNKNKVGKRIVIDSAIGNIPWGLLYDELVPESFDGDYIGELLKHFWATKYELEVLPTYPRTRVDWEQLLDNSESTRLTATVNKEIAVYGMEQQHFFEGMTQQFGAPANAASPLIINNQKPDVIASITKPKRLEPLHLLYFFCHHKKAGGTWMKQGYRNLDDTKMIIEGEDIKVDTTTIGLSEMRNNERITSFESPPVVFLNACESSQVELGDPTSFMHYFINILKAWAFIGTEAEIPAAFADKFGQRFIQEFLKGEPIGEIMFNVRRDYAQNESNPFGLYYTLYGDGNVRLTQAV